jgi:hypothetical protein
MSASTQAIKLDYNRLSCPTPTNRFTTDNIHIQMGKISFYIDMQCDNSIFIDLFINKDLLRRCHIRKTMFIG